VKIGSVDTDKDVYIIAEIGGNHNGDPEAAYDLVRAGAEAGANAVKFQTYRAETLVHPSVEPVPIVKKHYATQLERFKSLELDESVYGNIISLCRELAIDFMTTPFDHQILQQYLPHMPAIKISSGDLTYDTLISEAAASNKPVLLSTGMSTAAEIDHASRLVAHDRLGILHCVSIYPLPDEKVNLQAISFMRDKWPDITVGYSDHTIGPEASIAAVSLGARIIEKHFTLDTSQVPGDHVLSLDPDGMRGMVQSIRRINNMLGQKSKQPAEGEDSMRKQMRRGVYAARAIPAGHTLVAGDLICIRPENDFSPGDVQKLLGRKLKSTLQELSPVTKDCLE
jgi:sialic acid synthase SpsE